MGVFYRKLVAAFVSVLTFIPGSLLPAFAQTTDTTNTANTLATGPSTSSGIALDLTSTAASLPAPAFVQNNPITITVGGVAKTISSASVLTPAERLAAYQVFSTGQQSIVLGGQGNAIGGTFVMGPKFNQYVSSLVVPQGVTGIRDFGTASTLNLAGNLTNAGNIYALSSNPSVTNAIINASNIFNQAGGLLSSVLPAGGLAGFNSAVSSLSLSLSAINNIINHGTISSSGNLALAAGGAITNALPTGAIGPNPLMQAVNNINLQAASIFNQGTIASQLANVSAVTASLQNSGAIQALSGSVNIQNLTSSLLSVNNALGLIAARDNLLFAIPHTVANDTEIGTSKASMLINGGTLSANRADFTNPSGAISISVDRLDAPVHVTGGSATVGSKEGNLTIAEMRLSGDPIYFAQNGNLDLSGLFSGGSTFSTNGEDFVGLAGGNIIVLSPPTNATISAINPNGIGGKFTLAAGVDFNVDGISSPITCADCGGKYFITGPSTTGGSINMPGVSLTTNGGSITLQAMSNGIANNGDILIGNLTTASSNSNSGPVIATAASSIQTQAINASSSVGSGGNVFLAAGVISSVNSTTGGITIASSSTSGGSIYVKNLSNALPAITTTSTADNTGGNGGNVSLLALAGSSTESGQIQVDLNATGIQTGGNTAGGNVPNALSGNVILVANATSTPSSGGNTGFTISVGDVSTSNNTPPLNQSGNIFIATATGNFSTNIIVDGSGSSHLGTGAILLGDLRGGDPVDGAITAGNLTTAGGYVSLMAGRNAQAANAISTGSITTAQNYPQFSISTGNVSLMSATAGYINSATNGYDITINGNISTGSKVNGIVGAPILISSGGSILTGSVFSPGGAIFMVAGNSLLTTGNIIWQGDLSTSSSNNGGNVVLVTTGVGGTLGTVQFTRPNIFTDGDFGFGGAVIMSTTFGNISVGAISTTGGPGTPGGDVLLTSGSLDNNPIIIGGVINTSSATCCSGSYTPAGQIWVVTSSSIGQSNVSVQNTTQNDNTGNRGANPVLSVQQPYSVDGGTNQPQEIVFTPSTIDSGGNPIDGSLVGFPAGGFVSFTDAQGAVVQNITMRGFSPFGSDKVDTSLIVPIISQSSLSLTNGNSQLVLSNGGGIVSSTAPLPIAFFSSGPNTIQLGTINTPLVVNDQHTQPLILRTGTTGGSVYMSLTGSNLGINLDEAIVNGLTLATDSTFDVSIGVSKGFAIASNSLAIEFGGNVNSLTPTYYGGMVVSGAFSARTASNQAWAIAQQNQNGATLLATKVIDLKTSAAGAPINLPSILLSTASLSVESGSGGISGPLSTDASHVSVTTTGGANVAITDSGSTILSANLFGSDHSITVNVTAPGGRLTVISTGDSNGVFNGNAASLGSGTGGIIIQNGANITNLTLSGSINFYTSGMTAIIAPAQNGLLTIASGTQLKVSAFDSSPSVGPVYISSPAIVLGADSDTSTPLLLATGPSNINIDTDQTLFQGANITITGSNGAGLISTLATTGGSIFIGPCGSCSAPSFSTAAVGLGDVTFAGPGDVTRTIRFNGGNVFVNTIGNVTLNENVTVSSDKAIDVLMNNVQLSVDVALNQTLTLNAGSVLETTESVTNPGPSANTNPMDTNNPNTILIQALYGGYTLSGTGTFKQSGTTAGNTLFNDFTNIAFNGQSNSTNLTVESINAGGYTEFYSQNLLVIGSAANIASATVTVSPNSSGFTIGTYLPGPVSHDPAPHPDVSFAVAGSANAATLNLLGSRITTASTTGFGAPVNNITVGTGFNLISDHSVRFTSNDSTFGERVITINGSIRTTAANSDIILDSMAQSLTIAGTGTLQTTSTSTVIFDASVASSRITLASNSNLAIIAGGDNNGLGGTIDVLKIHTPNLFLGTDSDSSHALISANGVTGRPNITIDAGLSALAVDLVVVGPSGNSGTIANNGGNITLLPTGLANLSFTGNSSTLNFNTSGSGVLNLQQLQTVAPATEGGDITIDRTTTVSSNSPIMVNLNGTNTLSVNGTLQSSASNSTFSVTNPANPNESTTFQYSILIQNLITNFSIVALPGGAIKQLGATPGNTVFNDFTNVSFINGSTLSISSINPGSYVNFFTPEVDVSGTSGNATATLTFAGITGVNFNSNLAFPPLGKSTVTFLPGVGTTSATLNLNGAPVSIGYVDLVPPSYLPLNLNPTSAISIANAFTLTSSQSISMYATNAISLDNPSGNGGTITVDGLLSLTGGQLSMLAKVQIAINGGIDNSGGNVLFAGFATNGNLDVQNNGLIQATGNSGVVAFSGGSTGTVTVTGNGAIFAQQYAGFGDINPITLQVNSVGILPNQSSFTVQPLISVTQGLPIRNQIQVTGGGTPPPPPPPPTPTPTPSLLYAALTSSFTPASSLLSQYLASISNPSLPLSSRVATDTTDNSSELATVVNLWSLTYPTEDSLASVLASDTSSHAEQAREAIVAGPVVFDADTIAYLNSHGIDVGPSTLGNYLRLIRGSMLVAPDHDVSVEVQEGTVYIAQGSIVYVIETGNDVAIYNIHDRHAGDVQVRVAGKLVQLAPGKQLVLTKRQGAQFDEVNPGTQIAYRNAKLHDMGDGIYGFIADFSIPSALSSVGSMRQLRNSNNPADRAIAQRMMKMAAIASVTSQGREPYHKVKSQQP